MYDAEKIRDLNDAFRRSFAAGNVYLTRGVAALPEPERAAIMGRVRAFDAFTADNDPYGEHDFGSFEHGGRKIFWKVDCYDCALNQGSPNPADPSVTSRVLTVMLAEEY
jgi:hypothetical protein